MSELALRVYLAQQLDNNMTLPTGSGHYKTFTAHEQMLKRDVLGSHALVQIVRMRADEKRLGGARGIGTKQVKWSIDMEVVANGTTTEVSGGRSDLDDFNVIVDNVKKILRSQSLSPLPATLTDPETSETSVLTYLAEEIKHDTGETSMEAVQGRILFKAPLTISATEILNNY